MHIDNLINAIEEEKEKVSSTKQNTPYTGVKHKTEQTNEFFNFQAVEKPKTETETETETENKESTESTESEE